MRRCLVCRRRLRIFGAAFAMFTNDFSKLHGRPAATRHTNSDTIRHVVRPPMPPQTPPGDNRHDGSCEAVAPLSLARPRYAWLRRRPEMTWHVQLRRLGVTRSKMQSRVVGSVDCASRINSVDHVGVESNIALVPKDAAGTIR